MTYNSCFSHPDAHQHPQGADLLDQGRPPVLLPGPRLAGAETERRETARRRGRQLHHRVRLQAKPGADGFQIYGDKHTYDGELYAVDLDTLTGSKLTPAGMPGAAAIAYLCQLRYDPQHDLVLAGCTLPPGEDGLLHRCL